MLSTPGSIWDHDYNPDYGKDDNNALKEETSRFWSKNSVLILSNPSACVSSHSSP